MGAAQLIVFEAVRASRLCGNNGVRLREGCLDNCSHHGRHRVPMHARPEGRNPPGKPIHGDGDGRSSPIAQTGWHPFPGLRHQYQREYFTWGIGMTGARTMKVLSR
jgi:hypothetical protein